MPRYKSINGERIQFTAEEEVNAVVFPDNPKES